MNNWNFSNTKGFLSTIFVNFYAYFKLGVLNRGKGDLGSTTIKTQPKEKEVLTIVKVEIIWLEKQAQRKNLGL